MTKNVEETSTLHCLKMVSNKLKEKKLKNLSAAQPWLEALKKKLQLDTTEQVLAFVAVFDRLSMGRKTDVDDLTDFYNCTSMEALEMAPAMLQLAEKGLIYNADVEEHMVTRMRFLVESDVMDCILEGSPLVVVSRKERKFDQYDLCSYVSSLSKDSDIKMASLFRRTETLEREHTKLPLVKQMRAKKRGLSVGDRILFYIVCHDFITDEDDETSIHCTLSDIYDQVFEQAKMKKLLLSGDHPLMKNHLIEQSGEKSITLTDEGKMLLFGTDAALYGVVVAQLDRYGFVEQVAEAVKKTSKAAKNHLSNLQRKVEKLELCNKHLTFIPKLARLNTDDRMIFYLVAKSFVDGEGYMLDELENIYDKRESFQVKTRLKQKQHPLIAEELVELTTAGFFSQAALCLTDKGKELFLGEDAPLFVDVDTEKDIVKHADMAEKRLFFDPELDSQLRLLCSSLDDSNYRHLRMRLKEKHLPQGIAALLYGEPGTGKTESVMQIARQTGRDVMHVDISQTKSCWFGESEKIIKEVFRKYHRLCKRSQRTPILLFNEADAVFSKRKDSNSSNVAQTENAIQNIILEEMEKLDGILIATTNLANNLDAAFERRFLFKVRFSRPTTEAKQHIWMDKMPTLSSHDAMRLATAYNFSGGEIDNIVRKATMKELIEGQRPTPETLESFCKEERIASTSGRKIGFAS